MKKIFLLAGLFFLISMSLGYATLSRYTPRSTIGLWDTDSYAAMVENRPAHAYWQQFRVLIPTLARPVRALAEGRIGKWDPTTFSMLVVNGVFVAWAALVLLSVGARVTGDPLVGFCASLLYLVSFNVINLHLAGLVDSVEAWTILAATWSLGAGRWKLLPLIGAVGAAGKETSIVLLIVFCGTWWVALARSEAPSRGMLVWLAVMVMAQVATVVAIQSSVAGHFVAPHELAVGPRMLRWMETPFWAHVLNREMLYSFGWLLPLGLLRLKRMPRPWVLASAVSTIAVFALAVWFAVKGNVSRPAFNVAGPILILSASMLLAELVRLKPVNDGAS